MPKVAAHVAFARVATPKRTRKCAICSSESLRPIVSDWVEEWRAGRSKMTQPEAVEYLRKHHGYPFGLSAFSRCVREDFGHAAK